MELEAAGRFEWERILRRAVMAPRDKHVGHVLASYANKDGTNAHPGERRLAAVCCVSESTVRRALKRLRETGLVERTFKASIAGTGLSDCYRLVVSADLIERVAMLDANELPTEHTRSEANPSANGNLRAHMHGGSGHQCRTSEHTCTGGPVTSARPPHHATSPTTTPSNHSSFMKAAPLADASESSSFTYSSQGHASQRSEADPAVTHPPTRSSIGVGEDPLGYVTSVFAKDLTSAEESTAAEMLRTGTTPDVVISAIESERDDTQIQVSLKQLAPDTVTRLRDEACAMLGVPDYDGANERHKRAVRQVMWHRYSYGEQAVA